MSSAPHPRPGGGLPPPPAAGLPMRLFDRTPEQRLARARQQFFEDGVRPTGVVSEALIQSWSRCLRQRQSPARAPQFDPVSVSRVHSVLGAHRQLLAAAQPALAQLAHSLAGTPVLAMLLDATGVVMHVSARQAAAGEQILPVSARVGVCLTEERIGTNAPALTALSGQPSAVLGAEHFADAVGRMRCVAAPVHDRHGRLLAVLNLSVEGRPFGFDAAMLAGLSAVAIENCLLCQDRAAVLVLRLHCDATLLHGALAGLIGLDGDGRVLWLNAAAARLLDLQGLADLPLGTMAEQWLGQPFAQLLGLAQSAAARRLCLPSGLAVWVQTAAPRGQAEAAAVGAVGAVCDAGALGAVGAVAAVGALRDAGAVGNAGASDSAAAPPAAGAAAGSSLRDHEQGLVLRTLDACGGNVSLAARRLGVSRGLIYRQLQRGHAG
ncbi:helix-turn-helix domain-containing protein [Aquabacterium sp. OR-4]|uniref:helix-turn-helix domain-containing protein n=1 Tax=Aquabacterium sp. OR-4 TaxID=2978127 RepID=UPI0021B3F12E|nr:helix-turn-helix domain-containing protein [Aquabacterium sp. OR-4]MDT7837186.1 helix-turn-helix domain-containing protein [Aquabacterium sp. OR-4]